MSYLLLPADITLKALAHEIEEERNHAIELRPAVEDGELDEPPDRVRSEPGEMFEALSSDARPDEHIAVGANLSLFADPEPRPSAAFMAFTGGAAPVAGGGERQSWPRPPAIRAPPTSAASGCARSARSSSPSARARRARRTARSTRASTAPSACGRWPMRRSSSWKRRTSCCGVSWSGGGEADTAHPAVKWSRERCYLRRRGLKRVAHDGDTDGSDEPPGRRSGRDCARLSWALGAACCACTRAS